MLSTSAVLSLALLAGRLSGLLRELTLASLFGVTGDADAAVLLLTLPDLLVNLLISGGLSAALVPRFSALDANHAMKLFRHASLAVLLLFGIIGAILVAWPAGIFHLLAPGLQWPLIAGATALICVALALPLTGAAGVAGAYLNSNHRYFVTGCGTLIFNACVLIALLFANVGHDPLTILSFGIVAGATVRWSLQLLALPRGVWQGTAADRVVDQKLIGAFSAATIASALMLLAPIVIRALASTLGSGSIASFNYAQKLVELPVGILIASVSTVALTRVSTLQAQQKYEDAMATVVRDTRYALLMAVAVVILGLWFADSVVYALFSRGEMDANALERVVQLTRVALLAVPLVAMSGMATAYLSGSNLTHKVLKATMGSLILLPVLALPGVVFSSELSLMGAVVVFQAVAAVWLVRAAAIPVLGRHGVIGASAWKYLAAVVAIAAGTIALDAAIHINNHWLRLLLAACGFGVTLALPARRFLRSTHKQQITSTVL